MLPGRSYSVSDVLGTLRRWAWLIVPWPILGLAAAWAVSSRLPDRYRSETLILVVPQRVPEAYVRSTVTMRIEDRLRTISQEILSRTRLETIVNDFNLYPELRREVPLEDVIVRARDDVSIDIVRGDSFKISYSYSEPRLAQKVTERLAALFIEDNLRDREAQAEGTSQFLEAQLEDSRRRLIEQEKRLETYSKQYLGELPSQLPTNLQAIQTLQLQIQQLADSLNRDRDRRLVAERLLAEAVSMNSVPPAAAAAAPEQQRTPAQQLDAAEQQLAALQRRFTPAHPDVQRTQRRVQELKAQVAAVEGDEQPSLPAATDAAALTRQSELSRLRAEVESLDRQIAQKTAQEQELRTRVADYQARAEAAPTRESELTELTRDYDTLQAAYRSLLSKKEESRIATNLERRQIGEQFRILDPARVPERPYSPNRPFITGAGAVLGLMFGVALVVLIEVRDRTFRTETDIVQALALPVLALVPAVEGAAAGGARQRRIRRLVLSAATLLILAAGAGAAYWTWRS